VFSERLIFFRCKESIFREDLGPQEIPGSTRGINDLYGYFSSVGTSGLPLGHWFELIEDYLHRSLSVDDDILDASILTVLTPVIGLFTFGMPSSNLGFTLLWQDTPPQRRPAYPSWSSAGWAFPHALESPGHSYMNAPYYEISTAVKFFRFSSSRGWTETPPSRVPLSFDTWCQATECDAGSREPIHMGATGVAQSEGEKFGTHPHLRGLLRL
jgi:hypothetical protein